MELCEKYIAHKYTLEFYEKAMRQKKNWWLNYIVIRVISKIGNSTDV